MVGGTHKLQIRSIIILQFPYFEIAGQVFK